MQPPTNGPKQREYLKMSNFASLPGPSLTGSISSQRSYGATRADLNYTDTKFLSHKVIAGDTLQGIAVKYGVTVEKLKRANKIWSNESLFLLDTLKIPYVSQPQKWEEEDSDDEDHRETMDDKKMHEENKGENGPIETSEIELRSKSDEQNIENCNDFLNMIDGRINRCKEEWTKIRSHSQGSGVPCVSYDSSDANKLSPTKTNQQFVEKI
eukprot:Seg3151.1 transcript_id=Seg3151.1/GoldUCD/mRNA.D3Y31 product="LysM and putative peptidoglycan-binding domain-containing protein 2" protein_id=Seg3151.1/GoldUCD/D3Y31